MVLLALYFAIFAFLNALNWNEYTVIIFWGGIQRFKVYNNGKVDLPQWANSMTFNNLPLRISWPTHT